MRDPFGTADLRTRVLQAWTATPARFREDANAEEDYALGGYRDRLIVELAQNAADAAMRAGVPGVLRLDWDGAVLSAANTGAPLDAEGVQALASLRASAKDGAAVGRFGVGFAAVLSVSDDPQIVSAAGGVRFSAADSRAQVGDIPALSEEMTRRRGHVPVLRLPWPVDGEPPAGYATEVRLPVRAEFRDEVPGLLAAVPGELLLALPGLTELRIGDRVVRREQVGADVVLHEASGTSTWRCASRGGSIPAGLLADRPTEERVRDRWEITWAVPVDAEDRPLPVPDPAVLHAPTPSVQPVSVPARLIGTFPLSPDRRHVEDGPLVRFLIERAAECYADLSSSLPPSPDLLRLVPRRRLAADAIDAALSDTCLLALRSSTFLSTVEPVRLRVLERDIAAAAPVLDPVVDGLLGQDWSAAGHEGPLRDLGVTRLGAAEVVDLVSTVERPPAWWRDLYAALENAADRDALAGLPVPLVDGRVVTGARGAFLVQDHLPAPTLDLLGLRVIAPEAAHPLLERLGARPATPATLLAEDGVRSLVADSYDAEEPGTIAAAVLDLVRAAEPEPGALPWLADLALPGADGDWYPAGEMVLPGSDLDRIAAADAPYGRPTEEWIRRWGSATLEAVGVLVGLPVLRAEDVVLGDPTLDLPDEEAWHAAVENRLPEPDGVVTLAAVAAVGDLDLVETWPEALRMLGAEPLRSVVRTPCLAVLPGGSRVQVPSYTSWWLSTHPVLPAGRPDRLRLRSAALLAGLYDLADEDVDADLAALAGARADLAEILADPDAAIGLLHRLADPARAAVPALLTGIYGRLAAALVDYEVEPPPGVRVAPDRVEPADRVAVLDAPYLAAAVAAPLVGGPDPEAVADLLDVPLASALVPEDARPESAGDPVPWAGVPGVRTAARRCGAAVPDGRVVRHERLVVAGRAVPWWPEGADDHLDAAAGAGVLGQALAWRLGRWDRRAAAAEAFARPDEPSLALFDALESPSTPDAERPRP